jgi:hypothetical protein
MAFSPIFHLRFVTHSLAMAQPFHLVLEMPIPFRFFFTHTLPSRECMGKSILLGVEFERNRIKATIDGKPRSGRHSLF